MTSFQGFDVFFFQRSNNVFSSSLVPVVGVLIIQGHSRSKMTRFWEEAGLKLCVDSSLIRLKEAILCINL